jgi:predicted dehydrogenase
MGGDQAAFYRVYQKDGAHQIALVLLNKGAKPAHFHVTKYLQPGQWQPALGGEAVEVAGGGALDASVGPHDVAVYLLDAPATRSDLVAELTRLMRDKSHPDD